MLGTYGWFLGSPEYDVKFVICQIEFRELIISLIAGGCRCCVIGLLVHKAITFCIFEMLSGIGTKWVNVDTILAQIWTLICYVMRD
jgi:hypothetical protein